MFAFFAPAPLGLELLLADELAALGAGDVKSGRAGVKFSGDLAMGYRACLWSRLANRVLLPMASFPAADGDALYAGVQTIDWRAHLPDGATLAVDFAASRSFITHTLFGAQRVKDAIVDQWRVQTGERPTVDLAHPDLRVNVYLDRDIATVSVDLSGDSLHRRGYRPEGGQAPLKENLAAALLLRAGWPAIAAEGGEFLDPLCGSGTLPIEAAMLAADIAPGLARVRFGFHGWRGHDAAIWNALKEEAERRAEAGRTRLPAIRGQDIDARAVRIATDNVERAGLTGLVAIAAGAASEARPLVGKGLVLANPPYGERLGDADTLAPLYTSLGEALKQHFVGYRAAVLTSHPELPFRLGIRAAKQYALHNGALECRLFTFDVEPARFFQPREGGPPSEAQKVVRAILRQARDVDLEAGGAAMLANRLRKNLKNLGRWARQSQIACYRLYDADLPEYAVAVDLYAGERQWVQVQEYAPPASIDPNRAELRLAEAMAVIAAVLEVPPERLFLKVRRRQRGSDQYQKLAEAGQFFAVEEGGHRFWVNFDDYLDTGLFLDHREVRRQIQTLASGRRFLNLFAYTGSATVYAAKGGATATTTIDLSRTYLDWARRNLDLNDCRGRQHAVVQADCLEWLGQASRERSRFDLIFLAPPTFSTSKRMRGTWDVQRDHAELLRQTLLLLERGGILIFSTNCRKFRMAFSPPDGVSARDIGPTTLPRDFQRNAAMHHVWRFDKAD